MNEMNKSQSFEWMENLPTMTIHRNAKIDDDDDSYRQRSVSFQQTMMRMHMMIEDVSSFRLIMMFFELMAYNMK